MTAHHFETYDDLINFLISHKPLAQFAVLEFEGKYTLSTPHRVEEEFNEIADSSD